MHQARIPDQDDGDDSLLRSVALQNARAILLARERAEQELVAAKEELERKSEELAAQREFFKVTLSSIGDAVITTDTQAKITFLNPVAEAMTGWKLRDAIGQPLEKVFNIVNEASQKTVAIPVTEVLREGMRVALAEHTTLIDRNGKETPIEDSAAPIRDGTGKISGAVMVFHDVSDQRRAETALRESNQSLSEAQVHLEIRVQERTAELHTANENLRDLSVRLLRLQDEERRRLARELHDSVGQILAALSMNISIVQAQSHNLDSFGARAVSENAHLVEQASREIRTISHLLHPPLLEIAGLDSTLRWYVDGFSERSKIKVDLDFPSNVGRLANDTELAIFRIVQECLTNIHRHSESATAAIRIEKEGGRLLVEVKDYGKGMSKEKLRDLTAPGPSGVGFRGMQERLRELGGTLEIHSEGTGTVVRAILMVE